MVITAGSVLSVFVLSSVYSNKSQPGEPTTAYSSASASDWQLYKDPSSPLSFKLKESWTVKRYMDTLESGLYEIEIQRRGSTEGIKIFISRQGYYGIDNLPLNDTTIGGLPAVSVENQIYGIQKDENYYTIDLGQSSDKDSDLELFIKQISFDQQ